MLLLTPSSPETDVLLADPAAAPDHRSVLVGGTGPDGGPEPSRWLQLYDPKLHGWGRLGDMGVDRPDGCGAAAVGTSLYAFAGQGDEVEEPGHTTMYDVATRKVTEVAKPPKAVSYSAGVACGGCVYGLGGAGFKCCSGRRVRLQPWHG